MVTAWHLKYQLTALTLGLLVESPSVKVVTELYSELAINPLSPGSVHSPMALFFWARLYVMVQAEAEPVMSEMEKWACRYWALCCRPAAGDSLTSPPVTQRLKQTCLLISRGDKHLQSPICSRSVQSQFFGVHHSYVSLFHAKRCNVKVQGFPGPFGHLVS